MTALLVFTAGCSIFTDLSELTQGTSGGGGSVAGTASSASGMGGSGAQSSSAASNSSSATASSSSATASSGSGASMCGNGIIDPGEECDDSNDVAGDGCTTCVVDCSGVNEHKDPATFHCYRYEPLSDYRFTDARDSCKAWSPTADVVAIGSSAESGFLKLTVNVKRNTWIGLTDQVVSGTYQWVTGEPVTFTDWGAGFPDDLNMMSECVVYVDGLVWANVSCTSTKITLCERAPAGTFP